MKTSHLILIIVIIAVLILGGSFALKTFSKTNEQNDNSTKLSTNNTNSTVHMNSNISVAYTGESYSDESYYSDESTAYTEGY